MDKDIINEISNARDMLLVIADSLESGNPEKQVYVSSINAVLESITGALEDMERTTASEESSTHRRAAFLCAEGESWPFLVHSSTRSGGWCIQ